jgi:hypothetical protein
MKINSIRIYKIIKMRKLCKINLLINKVLSKKLLKSSIFLNIRKNAKNSNLN